MKRERTGTTILIGAATAAAAVGVFGGVPPAARAALTLPFLLLAPGLVWADRLGPMGVFARIGVSAALSLAAQIAIAFVLLWSGLWHPQWGFALLVGITALGCTGLGRAATDDAHGPEASGRRRAAVGTMREHGR
ncbi:MAG: hypothetical protein IRY94_09145 [Rhodospirillaceae bacterium]|nr:hypothetical protein [Rhodospirillaceae bacterium]